MAALQARYEIAFTWAEKARNAENESRDTLTYWYLVEAIKAFEKILIIEKDSSKTSLILTNVKTFREKKDVFLEKGISSRLTNIFSSHADAAELAEAYFMSAIANDEAKEIADAKLMYLKAGELYLQLSKTILDDSRRATFEQRANMIISRVEEMSTTPSVETQPMSDNVHTSISSLKLESSNVNGVAEKHSNVAEKRSNVTEKYSKEELDVLYRSSNINGQVFVPFLSSDIEDEQMRLPGKYFTDPIGRLQLSKDQKKRFRGWTRASQYFIIKTDSSAKITPKMITAVSPVHIQQEIVTDCSFVSSLCVASNYELKFRKQLITKIIYPKNNRGIPIYNPSGKYMVKLWLNGIPRKVLVDDYLPVGNGGGLLCSYSSLRNELWVSIIEKAYMKVNGGYDFPGSNSGIDLYALTGWIPEAHDLTFFNTEPLRLKRWSEMFNAFHNGDILITVATGNVDNLGLIPTHAYSVLNVIQVQGKKLLQVKNPWSEKRWRGRYSPFDQRNWTKELRSALNYDPEKAKQNDNGIFWIDYESLLELFDVIHLNWNPDLFARKFVLHRQWIGFSPSNDTIMLAHNPQFQLVVHVPKSTDGTKNGGNKGIVWILLSRHVRNKSQLLSTSKSEFLTLHVYDRRHGRLVLYPEKAKKRGVYSNNPHVLCALNDIPPGTHKYTLVVSAYEKKKNLDYSLTVYSTIHCNPAPVIKSIRSTLENTMDVKSHWKISNNTAGGSLNSRQTFMNNPQWRFVILLSSTVRIRIMTYKELSVNLLVFRGGDYIKSLADLKTEVASSGHYRPGFCYVEMDKLPAGKYTVLASTFKPGQEGPIHMQIECTHDFRIVSLI